MPQKNDLGNVQFTFIMIVLTATTVFMVFQSGIPSESQMLKIVSRGVMILLVLFILKECIDVLEPKHRELVYWFWQYFGVVIITWLVARDVMTPR